MIETSEFKVNQGPRTGKKRILHIFMGGTISMKKDPKTGANKPGGMTPEDLLKRFSKARKMADIDTLHITDVDSTDMTPAHWTTLVSAVSQLQHKYDGILVTHGTDTMHYTSAAVAYALGRTLEKPVVFTGAMMRARPTSDAATNFYRSLEFLNKANRNEVMLFFHDLLLRGTRARKVSESRFQGFDSPAVPELAQYVGSGVKWTQPNNPAVTPYHDHQVENVFSDNVAHIKIGSGTSARLMHQLIMNDPEDTVRGVVFETVGAGNIPKSYEAMLKDFRRKKIVTVAISSFPGVEVDMRQYDSGLEALKLGVIPGGDMTPEAAVVKTNWALGRGEKLIAEGKLKPDKLQAFVRKVFKENRAGEVTNDSPGFVASMKISAKADKK